MKEALPNEIYGDITTPSSNVERVPLTIDHVEDEAPKDKFRLVYFIVLLQGIGFMMPFNVFVNIAHSYYSGYKLVYHDEFNGTMTKVPTDYSQNFIGYFGNAAQIPVLIVAFLSIFYPIKNLSKSIIVSLIIIAVSVSFSIALVYVDTWSWMRTFFWLTMLSVVIMNSANGLYQTGVFALAADLPGQYTGGVITGNAVCGTFVSVLFLLSEIFSESVKNSTFAFLAMSFLTICGCVVSIVVLNKSEFYNYHAKKAAKQRENDTNLTGKPSAGDYWTTFKQGWPMLLNVFICYLVTLCSFPGLLLNIFGNRPGEQYDFIISPRFFHGIATFLLYNGFTFIGTLFVKYQWPSPRYVWILVWLRLLLVPFFAMCNYREQFRTFPVLFGSPYIRCIGAIVMSITHGLCGGLTMMYAPRAVEPAKMRIAAMMSTVFLLLGVLMGLNFSIIVETIVDNYGPLKPLTSSA